MTHTVGDARKRGQEQPDLRDGLIAVLAEHTAGMQVKDTQDLRAVCRGCEWAGPLRQSTLPANQDHRDHLADAVIDYMREHQ